MEKIKIEDVELIWRTKGTAENSIKLLVEKINQIIEFQDKQNEMLVELYKSSNLQPSYQSGCPPHNM